VIRRHWPFLTILVAGAVLRVLSMIAYRPAIFYIDSIASYLTPLGNLDPTGQDPIGYDMILLRPVLAVGNLVTVVAVQHALGLGMAIALYLLVRHKGGGRWLGAAATAPVLLDAYQVQIEQNIMSDPLFEALLVAALVVVAWPARPSWVHVTVAGVLLGASATVRQVGEVLFIPLIVYAVSTAARWWRKLVWPAVGLVAFAGPVALYAADFHHHTGYYALSNVGGNALYGRVATFADCTGVDLPPEERVLCPTVPRNQRRGTDLWAHAPESPYFTLRDSDPAGVDRLAADFSRRIIRHQPLDFATAVLADALKVRSWTRHDAAVDDPSVERWRFQRSYQEFPPLVTVESVAGFSAHYGGGRPAVNRPLATVLRGYQISVGYTPGPVLALAVVLAVAGALRRSWAALLFLLGGVVVLLAGAVVVFSWRYQLPGYVVLPVAGALGLVALRMPKLAPFPEPADRTALDAVDPALAFPAVVVLIAAYNEENGLGPVLDAIPQECAGVPIGRLVVVDGATDGTAAVARAHGAVTCELPANRGQGAALRFGYHLAVARGAKYVVTTDADGQYDVGELPLLLEPLLAGTADFVTGSRRLGTNESVDRVRRAGTRFFAWLVSTLTGRPVTDTSFGFRAMRAEVPVSVPLVQPQYQSSELLVGVLARGYRVLEQPMTMRARNQGRSKKGNNLVYGLRYARVVLSSWFRSFVWKTTRSRTKNFSRKSAA
jgi:Glycosyl transferase family 2